MSKKDNFLMCNHNIFQSLLYEWLDIKDICQLDIACCNHKQREFYLEALQSSTLPLIQQIIIEKSTLPSIIQWSKARNIQHPIKTLNLTQRNDSIELLSSYHLEELIYLESLFLTLSNAREFDALFSLKHLKKLFLNFYDVDESFINKFKLLFQELSHLQTLRLSHCEDLPYILPYLSYLPTLTELNIDNSRITKEMFQEIARLTQLQSLIFVEVIAEEGDDYAILSSLTNLTKLDLSYTNINNQGFRGLLKLTHLHEFKLICCDHLNFMEEFFEFGSSFSQLTYLNLLGTNIDNTLFQEILQCKHLQALSLSEFEYLSSEMFHHLSQLSVLQELSLYNNNIDDQGFAEICKLSHLLKLDLNGSYNISNWKEHISQFTHLESLTLSDCSNIDDDLLKEISKITTLIHLDLESCVDITLKGLSSLSQLIHLQSLNLKYTDIESEKSDILNILQLPNLTLYFL